MSVICMPGVVQLHEAELGSGTSEDVVETTMGPIRISVFRDIRLAGHAWRALQSINSPAPEQSFEWAKTWAHHVSSEPGNEIAIICGRSETGDVEFVWPFDVVTQNGLRCLQWIGQKYSNHNMGLHSLRFSRNASASDIKMLLVRAAKSIGNVSAAILKNQPALSNGLPNPLKSLPHRPSAAQGNVLLLDLDFATMYRNRFSGKLRNEMTRKARNLEMLGAVEFGWANSADERLELLNVMRQHKSLSYTRQIECNSLLGLEHQSFFKDISCMNNSEEVAMDTAYLKIDGYPVAISSGVFYGDTFSHFLTGCDAGLARKYTPEILLLHFQIEEACRRGMSYFDMGAGDAAYKKEWCDIDAPLFDSAIPIDERGYLITVPLLAGALLSRMAETCSSRTPGYFKQSLMT